MEIIVFWVKYSILRLIHRLIQGILDPLKLNMGAGNKTMSFGKATIAFNY